MNNIQRYLLKRKLDLEDLSVDMQIPFPEVLRVYTLYNVKLYNKFMKTEGITNLGKDYFLPKLENKAFDLTERWLSIYGIHR